MGETLGDLAKSGYIAISTGPFGTALHAHDYQETGVPVIPTEAIEPGRLRHDKIVRISEQKARELVRHRLQLGDIVFARRGVQACGLSAPVTKRDGEAIAGTGVITLRILAPEKVDPGFLACAVGAPLSVKWLKQHAIGATMPNLNSSVVLGLPIHLPDIQTQRAVAHVLGTLDDKIELNRRMNETLEAIARAIFKSWFVNFDPVRAKAEGRDPELPRDIVELFPARLVDSEIGEIPEGWNVKTLGDLLELAYGKALKAEARRDGHVPVYGSNGQVGWHDERLVAGPGIVVGRKGNPGLITWAPTDFFAIDTTFYVLPKEECRSFHFLFHALQEHDLASLGADSAVPGLNRNLAYMSAQIVPPRPLLEKFDAHASSLAARGHASDEESRTLVALRDALLPKLLSGELRVGDVSSFLGLTSKKRSCSTKADTGVPEGSATAERSR